jgi:hypothetical protein
MNWRLLPPNGVMSVNAQFQETYGMPSNPILIPAPVNPGAPGSTTPVMHATQYYRAGSTTVGRGRLIKTHRVQFYRGQARQ